MYFHIFWPVSFYTARLCNSSLCSLSPYLPMLHAAFCTSFECLRQFHSLFFSFFFFPPSTQHCLDLSQRFQESLCGSHCVRKSLFFLKFSELFYCCCHIFVVIPNEHFLGCIVPGALQSLSGFNGAVL